MEKLGKSPLVYVVAQVRIGAVLKMADYIPEIQERMRKANYLLFRPSEVREIEFGSSGAKTEVTRHWAFGRVDRTTGFSIQAGAVAFHTTVYDTHETFFLELEKGLEIVQEVVGIGAMERLGLRYVDAFQASDGHDLTDYLKEGLRGVSLDDIGARHQRSFTNLVMDTDVDGRLVVRVGLNPNGSLPENLLPRDLLLKQTFAPSNPLGILDYDHFIEKPEAFTVGRAMEQFKALHGIVKSAFLNTVSGFALEDWR